MSEARFVGPVDRILYLRTLAPLQGMSLRELVGIARSADERFVRKGHVLSRMGESLREFYILVSGQVLLRDENGQGIVRCLPGDNVGLVASLAQTSDRVEIIAEEDSILLAFGVDTLIETFEENFSFYENALRNLGLYQMRLLQQTVDGSVRAPWTGATFRVPDRELDVVEKLVLLRRGNIFQNIGLEAMVLMATSMVQERWPAGTRLWEIGERAGHLLVILQGEVECTLSGSERFTAGPGYPLGNIETLAREARWYVPVARTDLVTLRGDHEALFDVLEDDFDVAMQFLAEMARGVMGSIRRLAARGETVPGPMAMFRAR